MRRYAPKAPARRTTQTAITSRADWRELLKLARTCARDAGEDAPDSNAQLRLMALANQTARASTKQLEREAGATVADTARGFLRFAGAFARATTPARTRQTLAPVVEASAACMDDQLHALATDEFNRAHAGRPEVWG